MKYFHSLYLRQRAFQVALVINNLPANAGDVRDLGSVSGRGNGNLLQYSCLENPMDRGLQSIGSQRVGHN